MMMRAIGQAAAITAAIVVGVLVLSAFTDVGRRYHCPEGRAPIRTAFGDVVCAIKAEPVE